jgi:hypothetical protein
MYIVIYQMARISTYGEIHVSALGKKEKRGVALQV